MSKPGPGLAELPDKIIVSLLQYLDPLSLVQFEQTNKRHSGLAKESWLWQRLVHRCIPIVEYMKIPVVKNGGVVGKKYSEDHLNNPNVFEYFNNPKLLFKNYFSKESISQRTNVTTLHQIRNDLWDNLRQSWYYSLIFTVNFLFFNIRKIFLLLIPISILICGHGLSFAVPFFGFLTLYACAKIAAPSFFKAIKDLLFLPYQRYSHRPYDTFFLKVEKFSDQKSAKYHSAEAGIKAQQDWYGFTKAFFISDTWKHYPAYLAGREAEKRQNLRFKAKILA